jgi:Na+/H+ antiporter NhaD/arsenite permease-like protein
MRLDPTILSDARSVAAYVIFFASYFVFTITGSVANIIVVERARPDVHIGFREYFRLGLPLTALTLSWGILWLSLVR